MNIFFFFSFKTWFDRFSQSGEVLSIESNLIVTHVFLITIPNYGPYYKANAFEMVSFCHLMRFFNLDFIVGDFLGSMNVIQACNNDEWNF